MGNGAYMSGIFLFICFLIDISLTLPSYISTKSMKTQPNPPMKTIIRCRQYTRNLFKSLKAKPLLPRSNRKIVILYWKRRNRCMRQYPMRNDKDTNTKAMIVKNPDEK